MILSASFAGTAARAYRYVAAAYSPPWPELGKMENDAFVDTIVQSAP